MGFFDKLFDGIVGEEKNENMEFSGYNPENNQEPAANSFTPRPDVRTSTSENAVPAVRSTHATQNYSPLSGSAVEMKVARPDRFESAGSIADFLIDGNTVLLNLEDTNKETARKLIDFLSGVAYAIGGDLKKIANCTYVITPKFVNVSGQEEPKSDISEQNEASDLD